MSKKTAAPGVAGFDPLLGVFVDKDGNPIQKKPATTRRKVTDEDFKLDTRSVFEKDRSLHGESVVYDENGFPIHAAGKKQLPIKPRQVYRRGTRWRVVGVNVRIEAMCHYGSGANGTAIWSGWSRVLPVGTVVECIGWRRFRKDGLVAPQFVYPGLPAEAKWSTIWPTDSIWRPWPLGGILEPVTEEESNG